MWLILLIAVTTIWFIWTKWKLSYWQRKGVPNPAPNFIFGNVGATLKFTEHIGCLAHKWYNQFPNVPYVGYYKFSSPAIVLRDPDLIKNVLIRDFDSFHGNDQHISEKLDPLLAVNPFLNVGEKWKRGRNSLVPVFSAAKVKAIYPSMESACKKFTEYVRSQPAGKDFEAKSLSSKYTTENVIKCSFSLEAGCFEPGPNEYRDLSRQVFQPSKSVAMKFVVMPILPKWMADLIPIPFLSPEADKWFRTIVTENRKSRAALDTPRDDFMQIMLNVAQKMKNTDQEIAGHSLSLFIEGFETSSTVLSFLLYELARNPDVQEKVYEEIVEVSKRHDNKFTYEALQDLTYLECVLHESQRLNPVLLQLLKVCTSKYTLPKLPNQTEGVTITPGTSVLVPVRAIHLDPELYPNPEVFDPERFTEEARKERHKAHYLPFGEGPRMCMGMRFGHAQVKAGAMSIVRDFKITVSPNHKPIVQNPEALMWQPKDGILLNFEPRQN